VFTECAFPVGHGQVTVGQPTAGVAHANQGAVRARCTGPHQPACGLDENDNYAQLLCAMHYIYRSFAALTVGEARISRDITQIESLFLHGQTQVLPVAGAPVVCSCCGSNCGTVVRVVVVCSRQGSFPYRL